MGKLASQRPPEQTVNKLVAWELACARSDALAGDPPPAATAVNSSAEVQEKLVWAGPRERQRVLGMEVAATLIRRGVAKLPAISRSLGVPYT